MSDLQVSYQKLETKVKAYYPTVDVARLKAAFDYAVQCHEGQMRKSGEPYIIHPIAVAGIVADLELDMDSIVAALLHDCVEDTESTNEEVAKMFGQTVADLVDGVTKLTRVTYTSKAEEQMENLRKMLMAMGKDIRVILIKICDRLHNMQTMEHQTPRKQREKSLETLEIYAPIAHRLGMQRMKWQLEDLSLQYLDPVAYEEISQELTKRAEVNEEFMNRVQRCIKDRLGRDHIEGVSYGRIKHDYSIYRKMYTQNKTMDEIFDLYAFRVVVPDIADCYNVLGGIHDTFNPILGRFKDYIGTPKPNGYQSLHTTVIGRAGIPFEVQIRTQDMHQTAEYGVAAHWKYKGGMANQDMGTEGAFEWVRKLLESQQDTEAEEYVRTLKVDLFADEVFVFTPSGDVVNLPAGATPIDFAYSIHSAVGNAMTGCKVNGRIVTFDYQLKSGEIVEAITSKSANGPSRDWMKICKSNEAKNKIKQWFKKERREENIVTGRSMFESELKRAGIQLSQVANDEMFLPTLRKMGAGSLEDLYASIGYGGMTALKAANRIREEWLRVNKDKADKLAAEKMAEESAAAVTPAKPIHKVTRSDSGIIVEGIDNCLVKFAKCCSPVPGDDVIGFITRGFGVSVHRSDCTNAAESRRSADEKDRWLAVSWIESEQSNYETSLEVIAKDRDGLALDVTMALTTAKVKVQSFAARGTADGYAIVSIVLVVKDKQELASITNKLNQIPGVYQVKRTTG